ncbi:MAG: DUF1987 domain-containing protein [Bacteroidota bacterium]|nr:DUF1987 domain-containing protein [Bacteroidota bacterium]
MNKIDASALPDIVKLIVLCAKQSDSNNLPERSYMTFFLSSLLDEKGNSFFLGEYEHFMNEMKSGQTQKPYVISMKDSVQSLKPSKNLSKKLSYEQKIILVIFLMEQARLQKGFEENRMEMVRAIAFVLGLEKNNISDLVEFLFLSTPFSVNSLSVLYATDEQLADIHKISEIKHIRIAGLYGALAFFGGSKKLLLFRSLQAENIYVNGYPINKNRCYVCTPEDTLTINNKEVKPEVMLDEIFSPKHIKPVFIAKTKTTLEVILNPAEETLSFSGTSVPEDAYAFFYPLLHWLDKFLSLDPSSVTIHFKLNFFNTVSSKLFLVFLKKIEDSAINKTKVSVKWYFDEEDEDIMEAGENYAVMVDIPFEMIPVAANINLSSFHHNK